MALISLLDSRPLVTQNTSASGVASVVTLAADAGKSHSLRAIHVTYDGAPGVKTITIAFTQDGAAVSLVYSIAQTVNEVTVLELYDWVIGDLNTAVTVTGEALAAQTSTLVVFHA